MDCITMDVDSYETLKQSYDQVLASNRVLETENETLIQTNKLLKRLMNALENIKTNLEQKVLIITTKQCMEYSEQLAPFDREVQRLDEEYCHLKCVLNRLEFEDSPEEDDKEDVDVSVEHRERTDSFGQTIDDLSESNVETNEELCDENRFNTDFNDTNDAIDDSIDDNCIQYIVHQLGSTSGHQLVTTSAGVQTLVTIDEKTNDSTTGAAHELTTGLDDTTIAGEESALKRRNRRSKAQTIPGMKRFVCSWEGCEYATDSSGNFQKHYRIHTGEKPYKCDFDGCEYSCSDPGSIKEHKRIHSVEKQFCCEWPGCCWKFSTYKLLKNHRRACHTGEKPHKCDWPGCDKSFLAPYALRTHKLKHTGDRPHKCDVIGCRAAFTRTTDLARHKRETHSTERHYPCEHENCESKFYRKDDLRHHVKRKHECPQFGRKRKGKKMSENREKSLKLMRKKSPKSTGSGGADGTGSDATDGLEEPKVVIDLNVAKVNQLRKSIQINFV